MSDTPISTDDLLQRLEAAEQKNAESELRIAELEAKLANLAAKLANLEAGVTAASKAGTSRGGAKKCGTINHWISFRVNQLDGKSTAWNDIHVPIDTFERFLNEPEIAEAVVAGVREDALAVVRDMYGEWETKLAENAAKVGKGKGKAKEMNPYPTAFSIASKISRLIKTDALMRICKKECANINSQTEVAEIADA